MSFDTSTLWNDSDNITYYLYNTSATAGSSLPAAKNKQYIKNPKLFLQVTGGGYSNSSISTGSALLRSLDSLTVYAGSETAADDGTPFNVLLTESDGTQITASATIKGYETTLDNQSGGYITYVVGTFVVDGTSYNFALAPGNARKPSLSIIDSDLTSGLPSVIYCFLPGVEIEIASGVKLVEDLKINDEVIVWHNNQKIIKKITSIISKKIIVKNKDQFPIRILKSAISENIPYKDLLVTPEHCLFIDGQFIPARMLVNGRSIIQDTSLFSYNIFHIETDEHSVVIADGMLTESYLNTDHRINKNLIVKGTKSWEKDAAAPLNTSRNFVEPIYINIENRAKSHDLSDIRPKYKLTNDHDLYLSTLDGYILSPISRKDDFLVFRLPPDVNNITLNSRTSKPSDIIGSFVDDRRSLGVLVGDIILIDGEEICNIDTHFNSDTLLGWSNKEQTNCRWTLGKAELVLNRKNQEKINIIKIQILAGGPYFIENKLQNVEEKEVS